ncbi:MAG: site-specific DNA-methyltransferase [Anaeroplasmataceae bacterium]|nr:site-specific DNA-methyltransferase [Anaeroplasmataceae bacterium]
MSEKLTMSTKDLTQENIKKIRELFPNAVTECVEDGKTALGIDFDILKQELSNEIIDDKKERYQMTWPDKKKSILLANQKINATLRPVKEESVDFDNTQNLYIEGDNLDVLKLLRETYLGKVKMIYIDPPYNTGNDFIYNDEYAMNSEAYTDRTDYYDEQGNRLEKNLDSNGRFHTDWLNMIYPRLKIARDIIAEDGVIFISIDSCEVSNLIKLCDELLGEKNRISFVTRVAKTASNMGEYFAESLDYVICYAKNINKLPHFKVEVDSSLYKKVEIEGIHKGEYFRDDVAFFQSGLKHGGSRYPIVCPDGQKVNTPDNKPWRANEETFNKWKKEGRIVFKKTNTSPLIDEETGEKAHWNLYTKSYLIERQENGTQPRNILNDYINRRGADLIKTFGIPFDFAKPLELMVFLIKILNDKNGIILDFFSGSATTAHAVMQLNAEDNGNRRFIMVQLPEVCDEKSEAYKVGYENICEIGKERICRAAKKIKDENPLTTQDLDTGFRVLKLDSSNMNDVYYNPSELEQNLLDVTVDNIKHDRNDLDLLFQVMLELGVLLSSKIEEKNANGTKYYCVNDNDLVACFDMNLTNDAIVEIAKLQPLYAVFKNSSFGSDSVGINNEQIFKTYSPSTVIKVL